MPTKRSLSIALLAALLFAASARAQLTDVARIADSVAAAGDTAGALAMLDRAVHANRRDAAAWHEQGMIAWAIVRPRRSASFMSNANDIRLLQRADSSLRLATQFAPDSARYAIDLARFFLNSNLATLRIQTGPMMERAVESARRSGDKRVLAEAADELGMVNWRRYEALADRRLMSDIETATGDQFDQMLGDPKAIQAYVEHFTHPQSGWSGEGEYLQATQLFAEARAADPNYGRAMRHEYMALAERQRWDELRAIARKRIAVAPWDADAWLASGLANHRLNDEHDAAAAFDSALALLPGAERDRYTRISRLLRPRPAAGKAESDSARYAKLSPAGRDDMDRVYWLLADPLTLTPENEHRLEFMSRVEYSDLRWSSDDFDLRGADTDRGDIHIRYGPPQVSIGFPPENGVGHQLWLYDVGFAFFFRAPPTWGTASFSGDFAEEARRLRSAAPVLFANGPLDKHIDSIRVQIARFRASGDSADLFVAAEIPIDSLLRNVELRPIRVDVAIKVYDNIGLLSMRDSSRTSVDPSAREGARMRAWRVRSARGGGIVRVEALQPDQMNAARSLGYLEVVPAQGFGVSDLLLAERVLPRVDSPARWSDFNILPSAGRFHRRQEIGVLWETYALAADSAAANHYRIGLTLERVKRGGAGALVAKIVGGVGDAVGRSANGADRVTLSFDRTTAARAIAPDYLTLDLGEATPGQYRLTIEVTDLTTKQTATRTAGLTVLE